MSHKPTSQLNIFTFLLFVFYRQEIEYYGNKKYEHPLKGYSGEQIVQILCNPSLSDEIICCTHPVLVESNVSFIVDLSKLAHPHDVCDNDLDLESSHLLYGRRCTIARKQSKSAMMDDIRWQYSTDNDFH